MVRRYFAFLLLALILPAAERYGKPYDAKANPAADLESAKKEAAAGGKRILVDVGGEWCGWCHRMEAFIAGTPDIRALVESNYVLLKVNFSEENKNEKFLSAYPKIDGYPHLFVLDAGGKLLQSQNTGDLEEGKGYNAAKFKAFLQEWAPRR